MADKVEKILDIKVNYNEAIKAIAEYQTKIDKAKEAEAKLKEQLKAGDIKRQQYNEEMAASKAYINDCNDSIRVITKTMQNQLKQEKAQENSLVSLRAKLSNLTAEYDALSEAERNAATGIKLRDKINEVTDALKDAEEETQRYYRNVGNYKEAIMEAANANIPFVQQINVMVTSLGGVKNYISNVNQKLITVAKTTTGLTRVVKLLGTAMLGLGIGALLVVLASLVSWFTKTQKGVEAANKIMGALGATVNVLIDRAGKLGSALVNLFTGNFKQAGNDAKSIFAGIGDEIVNETKQAWKLAEVLNEIDKREVMLSMSRAANRAEIEKLKKAADDQTLSTQERIKAAEKAAAMEKEDLKIQTDLAKARIANMLGYTKVTKEALNTFDDIISIVCKHFAFKRFDVHTKIRLIGVAILVYTEIGIVFRYGSSAHKITYNIEVVCCQPNGFNYYWFLSVFHFSNSSFNRFSAYKAALLKTSNPLDSTNDAYSASFFSVKPSLSTS